MIQPAFQPPRAPRDPGPANASESAPERCAADLFLKEFEEAYAALREDPAALAEIEAETSAWDGTLMDGLEDESA
ncbi:MAG: hypothetical protein ICV87_00885 [Gemmatimonadetes bacterium]|nr:hypothetical protein [Gemmatimonadota bacterium]